MLCTLTLVKAGTYTPTHAAALLGIKGKVTLATIIAMLQVPGAQVRWYSIRQVAGGMGMGHHLSRALGVVINGRPYIISHKGTVHGHRGPSKISAPGVRAQIAARMRAGSGTGTVGVYGTPCPVVQYKAQATALRALRTLVAGARVSTHYAAGLTQVAKALRSAQRQAAAVA